MTARNIDPDVARCRAAVAGLTARKAPLEKIQNAQRDLDVARRMAALRAAVRDAPPLTPEIRDGLVALLYAVARDDGSES